MDPNEALTSILRGHMIADHAEALRDWLRSDGFAPRVALPADCHPAFSEWPRHPAEITADTTGLYVAYACPDTDPETMAMSWRDVFALDDSEY